MNLIQAYKKAKVGDEIIFRYDAPGGFCFGKTANDITFITNVLPAISGIMFDSDDWQIKRKPLVWEGESFL